MPELAYIGCVEISPHDVDTIYLAATRYKLADYKPYLFRSTDGGRTFQSINGDFPGGEITRVVRADPARKGLLFVGTEIGVYYSLNDGQSWMRMGGGLPVVPVYDLKIKGTDLVAGTHGRSFWILDDITPLRGLVDGSQESRFFEPRITFAQSCISEPCGASGRAALRTLLLRAWARGSEPSVSRTGPAVANIWTSGRIPRTARSFITGWTRAFPARSRSHFMTTLAQRSRVSAAMTVACQRQGARRFAPGSTGSCGI